VGGAAATGNGSVSSVYNREGVFIAREYDSGEGEGKEARTAYASARESELDTARADP
jgi:hypothetical protein